MNNIDLNYANKEGYSLNDVLSIITIDGISKKEIADELSATKSIDTLLSKLTEANLIIREKIGTSVLFKLSTKTKKISKTKKKTNIDEEALDILKKELESVPPKKSKIISHVKKVSEEDNIIAHKNPYGFLFDLFVTELNGEISTNYFRRRDDYILKSLFNKLQSMCVQLDNYNIDQQNVPFYRAVSVNIKEKIIRIYHIDMNRTIRGIHNVFQLTDNDIINIEKGKENEY